MPTHPDASGQTFHWLGRHAILSPSAFERMDRMRRAGAALFDAAGWGSEEAPFHVLQEQPGCRVRRYAGASDDGPVLLIVPAPIKRSYIWDLAPGISVVRRCLGQGLRVCLVEWLPLDADDPQFGLSDYAGDMLSACLDAIEADTGQTSVVLAGHSLGGTLATIFACRHPQRVRSLIALDAPLHFGKQSGCFAPFVETGLDTAGMAQTFGNVPGSFLSMASALAAPYEFQLQRCVDAALCLTGDRQALATHMRVERWALDEFPLPGQLFADVVEQLYRQDRLMRGELAIQGRQVGPSDLIVPLLNVFDPASTVSPADTIIPFHQAAASPLKKLLAYEGDVGVAIQHVGVLVGRNAHDRLWPEIFDWLSACTPGFGHAPRRQGDGETFADGKHRK